MAKSKTNAAAAAAKTPTSPDKSEQPDTKTLQAQVASLTKQLEESADEMLTRSRIEKAEVEKNAAIERANTLQTENSRLLNTIEDLKQRQMVIDRETGSAQVV